MCDFSRLTILLTFVLSLILPTTIQAKSAIQQSVPKPFNAEEAFSVQSAYLRNLMLDFYECQPESLLKNTKVSKEEFVQWVFEGPFNWKFEAINRRQGIAALMLSFNTEYQGDRVLPLITGLYTALLKAYGGKNEYTFITPVNPHQQLIIAAHNVALSATKLQGMDKENVGMYQSANCADKIQRHLDLVQYQLLADYRILASQSLDSKNDLRQEACCAKDAFISTED